MVCIAIAAKRMPTTRDITVEIVKLINFEPQAAAYRINAEKSMATNIEPTLKKNALASWKSLKTIIEVMAAGPASNGTASGLEDKRTNSSWVTLSAATLLFLACRLPLTISTAIMNKIAPPAMLKVSADIRR